MIGRLYAIIFILLIAFSLWYQKKYLEVSSNELNSQLDFEDSILPTSIAKNFNTKFYDNGKLKYTFSGDKIIYFTDNHFEAEGNLIYESYDEKQKNNIVIKTQKAFGIMESDSNQSLQQSMAIGANSRIKNATLPNDVLINFDGNNGKANYVFIDMEKETIQSPNYFISNGTQGNIKGNGFKYSIKNEEFKIFSNVDGDINLNKIPETKKDSKVLK
ncbi:LPS export ABC transporter periplasmic protein LptC [Silvanigrella sp.]|jgi:lipopolysaccharide export system protein LptC|uniref:LPS export ABC transporter periplasmic protein LptC n=1 Tax=Silvanigrella sp. TaxID=2024976 RepID=UPI0037CB60D2|nr:LPS export ABC transporter periplasmic protein LptC [Silvanigrellaceae bacterium]